MAIPAIAPVGSPVPSSEGLPGSGDVAMGAVAEVDGRSSGRQTSWTAYANVIARVRETVGITVVLLLADGFDAELASAILVAGLV
ncbi:hypothetical protein VTK26DRAFT_3588 [Humicola hyalothermophila]